MTPEQQILLDKAARSLQAARQLNNTGLSEFVASRAYYAMFYVATAFLEGEGLSYTRHSAVIPAFGRQFTRTQRIPVEYHRYLIDAERIRVRGDDDLEPNITETQAEELISQADEILNFALTNIDSLPP
ncbi:MAG: HEPN domain-containing protein [Okeania sp. SIO3I5]|uniref:HEPN domain-containing protein n=1 Tax=Okeania sp. SIO3I5 TaxID=2607805 RepID=UPI0013B775FE|nr:HEPN domain-containing protein [Okeania sp. SIO3I5]NEQ37942.1 HEPN domain-containing protein [Okeania sp. SIO3I5]